MPNVIQRPTSELLAIANACQSYTTFVKDHWAEYQLLRDRGLLAEATAHMQRGKKPNKFTDDDIILSAKPHATISAWRDVAPGMYDASRRRGLFDLATAHMRRKENPSASTWILYQYTFTDGGVYVGITHDPYARKLKHSKEGPVFEHAQATGEQPSYTQQGEGMPSHEAAVLEIKTIAALRVANGTRVLNGHLGGSLGSLGLRLLGPNKGVRVLTGAPGAGKSTVLTALGDSIFPVDFDNEESPAATIAFATHQSKPIVCHVTSGVSTLLRRLTGEYAVALYCIVETEEVLATRLQGRGGESTKAVRRRAIRVKQLALLCGGFGGTCSEVLAKLTSDISTGSLRPITDTGHSREDVGHKETRLRLRSALFNKIRRWESQGSDAAALRAELSAFDSDPTALCPPSIHPYFNRSLYDEAQIRYTKIKGVEATEEKLSVYFEAVALARSSVDQQHLLQIAKYWLYDDPRFAKRTINATTELRDCLPTKIVTNAAMVWESAALTSTSS